MGTSQDRITLGLIGVGRLGEVYAQHIAGGIAGARLAAIADTDGEKAKRIAERYGVEAWYSDPYELLMDPNIDAIVNIAPTHAHKDLTVSAAEYGKAIFCEKPVALTLKEANAMQEAVRRAGTFFQIGCMRRFDAGYRAAKEQLDQGTIGRPVLFKSTSRDPFPPPVEFANPKSSGGLILDMGIHDFDIARWFMGEVESVYAIGGTLVYPELGTVGDIDNTIISLTFANGGLGEVDLSRTGIYGYDIATEVLGANGALRIGYLREAPLNIMTKGTVAYHTVPYFMQRFGAAYKAQVQDFVDNLRIALAATKSREEGRIVKVSEVTA